MWISNAFAQAPAAAPGGLEGLLSTMAFPAALLAFMYFVMIRPQMKRTKEAKIMLEALTVGDEVVTVGGIMGKVTALKDQVVTVEISAGTEVQMQKGAITTVLPKGTLKSA